MAGTMGTEQLSGRLLPALACGGLAFKPEGTKLPVSLGICNLIRASQAAAGSRLW